jgi:POT family proton-dependent oligopeptide transporter
MCYLAMAWLINSPMTKISKGALNIFNFEFMGYSGNTVAILTGLVLFLFLLVYRLMQYSKITRDKLMAVTFFAFITIFFWAIFEQSPNSLTVFAEKYTDRVLTGNASLIFLIINSLMTLVPLLIINWVMFKLFKETFKKYAVANIILSFSFVIIWIIALWMLAKDYYTAGYLTLSDGVLDALKIDKVTTPLTEVPATWFSTLNSLFIISLAPVIF